MLLNNEKKPSWKPLLKQLVANDDFIDKVVYSRVKNGVGHTVFTDIGIPASRVRNRQQFHWQETQLQIYRNNNVDGAAIHFKDALEYAEGYTKQFSKIYDIQHPPFIKLSFDNRKIKNLKNEFLGFSYFFCKQNQSEARVFQLANSFEKESSSCLNRLTVSCDFDEGCDHFYNKFKKGNLFVSADWISYESLDREMSPPSAHKNLTDRICFTCNFLVADKLLGFTTNECFDYWPRCEDYSGLGLIMEEKVIMSKIPLKHKFYDPMHGVARMASFGISNSLYYIGEKISANAMNKVKKSIRAWSSSSGLNPKSTKDLFSSTKQKYKALQSKINKAFSKTPSDLIYYDSCDDMVESNAVTVINGLIDTIQVYFSYIYGDRTYNELLTARQDYITYIKAITPTARMNPSIHYMLNHFLQDELDWSVLMEKNPKYKNTKLCHFTINEGSEASNKLSVRAAKISSGGSKALDNYVTRSQAIIQQNYCLKQLELHFKQAKSKTNKSQ